MIAIEVQTTIDIQFRVGITIYQNVLI